MKTRDELRDKKMNKEDTRDVGSKEQGRKSGEKKEDDEKGKGLKVEWLKERSGDIVNEEGRIDLET